MEEEEEEYAPHGPVATAEHPSLLLTALSRRKLLWPLQSILVTNLVWPQQNSLLWPRQGYSAMATPESLVWPHQSILLCAYGHTRVFCGGSQQRLLWPQQKRPLRPQQSGHSTAAELPELRTLVTAGYPCRGRSSVLGCGHRRVAEYSAVVTEE